MSVDAYSALVFNHIYVISFYNYMYEYEDLTLKLMKTLPYFQPRLYNRTL